MRRSPLGVSLAELLLAKLETLELPGGGFGEFGEKFDPAGALVAAYALCDEVLEFVG